MTFPSKNIWWRSLTFKWNSPFPHSYRHIQEQYFPFFTDLCSIQLSFYGWCQNHSLIYWWDASWMFRVEDSWHYYTCIYMSYLPQQKLRLTCASSINSRPGKHFFVIKQYITFSFFLTKLKSAQWSKLKQFFFFFFLVWVALQILPKRLTASALSIISGDRQRIAEKLHLDRITVYSYRNPPGTVWHHMFYSSYISNRDAQYTVFNPHRVRCAYAPRQHLRKIGERGGGLCL